SWASWAGSPISEAVKPPKKRVAECRDGIVTAIVTNGLARRAECGVLLSPAPFVAIHRHAGLYDAVVALFEPRAQLARLQRPCTSRGTRFENAAPRAGEISLDFQQQPR